MAKKIRIPFGNDLPISFKLAAKNLDGTITPIRTSDVQNLVVKYGSSSPAQAMPIDYTSDENFIYVFLDSKILKRGAIYSFYISGYRNGLDFSLNFVNVIEVVTDNDDANYLDFVIDMQQVEYGGFFIGLKNYDETIRPYIEDAERATENANTSAENANTAAANANASEIERNENERKRIESENARAAAEQVRQEQESERVAAEAERKKTFNELKASLQSLSQVQEDIFALCDSDGNIALKYDNLGFDVAKISEHFASLLSNSISGSNLLQTIAVDEPGLYYVDSELNIGEKRDKTGTHAINLVEYINQ